MQYVNVAPDQGEVFKGLFVPWCENCDSDSILQVGLLYELYCKLQMSMGACSCINRSSKTANSKTATYSIL